MTIYNKHTEIFDEVEIVEHHFHNMERWFGKSTDQSGNIWAKETLTPYTVASSGIDTWSTNHYAKVFGSSDTPTIPGKTKFDSRRIMVSTISSTEKAVYKLRLI